MPEDDALDRWVRSTLHGYPWSSRRGLNRVHPAAETALGIAGWDAARADARGWVAVEHGPSGPAAVAPVRHRAMESEAFGFAVGSIDAVISPAEQPDRPGAIGRVLRRVLERAGATMALLVLKVDAGDVEALQAAQQAGFAVCDVALTSLVDRHEVEQVIAPPPDVTVEVHHPPFGDVLTRAAIERLSAQTATWDLNHYRADPRVPRDAIERFYGQWIPNIGSGSWSDHLVVARRSHEVVAAYSGVIDPVLDRELGVKVLADTWIVSDGSSRGVARAMLSAGVHQLPPGARYTEWETQARNVTTQRAADAVGSHPIRASYTLHAWPGDG